MQNLTYEIMRPTELKECAALAAKAFENYDYFSNYIPNLNRRRKFLQNMIEIEFELNRKKSFIYTAKLDGKIIAVAMLCAPSYTKPSDADYLRAGFWKTYFLGGVKNVVKWCELEQMASAPCHELKKDAWYLSLLTVSPEFEGLGYGKRFLNECIFPAVEQKGGKSLCLFTNAEGNRRFYGKNGMTEFDEKFFTHKGKELGSWSYEKAIRA